MTKTVQSDKNLELSTKLAEYIADNPNVEIEVIPSEASIVPFSATDKELNNENEKLVESLKGEGKPIVKAKEPKNNSQPWEFVVVSY
jgi:glutamate/tyrosine decarboxylase-like PLP-dependent enzyme